MLPQPGAQRHILVGGSIEAVCVNSPAKELPANGVAAVPEMADRHVVLRAHPAVAVTVEENLARDTGPVGAGGVPEAPVEEDGGSRLDADRYRAGRLPDPVRGLLQRVPGVTARHDPEVAAARLRDVREE